MTESRPSLVVDASAPAAKGGLRTLWKYRELLGTLAQKDFRVRFVQTRLGYIWAVIQPLFLIAILTFLFGRVLNVDTLNIPYPLFALSGQVLWSFFSFSAVQGGQSLVQSQHMIRKIWFPRVVLPLSKAGVGMMDLAIGLILLLILTLAFGIDISSSLIWTIPAIALTIVAGTGISLWTSALGIKFRDVQHALPYLIQFLFFLTPVAYPSSLLSRALSDEWTWLAYLNPMAAPIDLIRYGFFERALEWNHVLLSSGIAVISLLTGWIYFHKVERNMADTL